MNNTEMISRTTSYAGKLLRTRFGKGPESMSITMDQHTILIQLHHFLNPVEAFLLNEQEEQTFLHTRELVMKSLLPELIQFLEEHLNLQVDRLYYDWGMHNASGIIAGILHDPELGQTADYEGKQTVHQQINEVTGAIQRQASFMDSWWLTPNTLAIFRKGITVLLEKELCELGYENQLRAAKRRLEKRLLQQQTSLESLFQKEIEDVYTDWNFQADDSLILYTFKS
ncbi:Na-translocating system protein MpsC family protein [Paenibacillus sp. WLX2291]|uniref:Na-translocating system protein MpsC family protein n=1 Tax=Paenibacillus sp. WLX2291 TaxID=3296934 RepID=UPI0039840A32